MPQDSQTAELGDQLTISDTVSLTVREAGSAPGWGCRLWLFGHQVAQHCPLGVPLPPLTPGFFT